MDQRDSEKNQMFLILNDKWQGIFKKFRAVFNNGQKGDFL